MHGKNGSFLIHRSDHSPNVYTLSVRCEQVVRHIKIQNDGDYYNLDNGQQYSSLAQVIGYLRTQDSLIDEDGGRLVLKEPCNSEYPAKEKWVNGVNQSLVTFRK